MVDIDSAGWPHLFRAGDVPAQDAAGTGNAPAQDAAGPSDAQQPPVLLMLHGTGSTEVEIAHLAQRLDPAATVLAPRGRVSEFGANRWFRRLAEGVFDVDDVISRAGDLAAFVGWAREHYAIGDRSLVAVGFSNGANMALATAMLHPEAVDRVIAFSGMYPLATRDAPQQLSGTRVFLANGRDDPMAPSASVERLASELARRGASVERTARPGGHGIVPDELGAAQRWLHGAGVR